MYLARRLPRSVLLLLVTLVACGLCQQELGKRILSSLLLVRYLAHVDL